MLHAMATKPIYLAGNKDAVSQFLDSFDVFLFDCDGVLWSGEHLFDKVPEVLDMLRRRSKQVVFVTNNSTKSRADYQKKLASMGIQATEEEVFGSAYAAAIYIARVAELPADKAKVFVLGESGIETELRAEGVAYVGGTDAAFRREMTAEDYPAIASGKALDPAVGTVLAGLDFHVNYLKLSVALAYLQRGATFLATNVDSTLPSAHGLFPGAGAIAAPLIRAIGREPLALGKPSPAMMAAIEGKFRLNRARTCMVGDRLNTDIRFGIDGGLGGTLHVLTGVSPKTEWDRQDADIVPKYYTDQIGDLIIAAE